MADNFYSARAGDSLVARLMADAALGCSRRSAARSSTLHAAGDPADEVFLLQQGQVRLYQLSPDGSRRLLDILGPGEWFGAAALGGQGVYGCQAVAQTPTVVCVLSAGKMLSALAQRPETCLAVIRQLAGRLTAATEEAAHLAFDDCRHRLVKTLLRFSRCAAATMTEQGVELHLTHEELAQAVGAARETVSLTLTELRRENLLRTGRNRVMFDPDALRSAASELYPSNSSTIFA